MIVDEFNMDCHYHLYSKTHEWDIHMRDGDTKISFTVGDDLVQESLRDNWDYISDMAAKEIADRVLNLWDESRITDEQKQTFLDVLRMVIG